MRAAEGLFVYNKTNFHYLPQNIAFDDLKSVEFATSGMSMILIDAVNHHILDGMKDRGAGQLRAVPISINTAQQVELLLKP